MDNVTENDLYKGCPIWEWEEALKLAQARVAELAPVKESWKQLKRDLDLQREINVELAAVVTRLRARMVTGGVTPPDDVQEIEARLAHKGVSSWGRAFWLNQPDSLRLAALHAIDCWRLVQGVPDGE